MIMTWGPPKKRKGEKEKKKKLLTYSTQYNMESNSEHGSPGWQTDPENPMLGPNGQLQDAHERPQQFVYSPLEATAKIIHLHDNTEDDLPAALRVDVNNTRPKWTINLITHQNPLEVFKQQKQKTCCKNQGCFYV